MKHVATTIHEHIVGVRVCRGRCIDRRRVRNERVELATFETSAAQAGKGLSEMLFDALGRSEPTVRSGLRETTSEHGSLSRTIRRRPGDRVVATIGMTTGACAAIA